MTTRPQPKTGSRWRRGISTLAGLPLMPIRKLLHYDCSQLAAPDRCEQGLVLVLSGIEGYGPFGHSLAMGLGDVCPQGIELFEWTPPTGCVAASSASSYGWRTYTPCSTRREAARGFLQEARAIRALDTAETLLTSDVLFRAGFATDGWIVLQGCGAPGSARSRGAVRDGDGPAPRGEARPGARLLPAGDRARARPAHLPVAGAMAEIEDGRTETIRSGLGRFSAAELRESYARPETPSRCRGARRRRGSTHRRSEVVGPNALRRSAWLSRDSRACAGDADRPAARRDVRGGSTRRADGSRAGGGWTTISASSDERSG